MRKVSIGMPVFNGERFLEDALRSLASQTFTDFEVIMCDNASTDGTREIWEQYKHRFAEARYIRNPVNYGAARNYNLAFQESRGKYFKWAAHDDMLAPDYLEKCYLELERDPALAIAHTETMLIDESGRELGVNPDNLTLMSPKPHQRLAVLFRNVNLCNPILGVIRSELLKRTSLIGNYIGSDYILLLQLCLLGKIREIPEPLFYRRDHASNLRKLPMEERAKWFDAAYAGTDHLHLTKVLFRKQSESIWRADLSLRSRMLCMFQLRRWLMRRTRNRLGEHKQHLKRALTGAKNTGTA